MLYLSLKMSAFLLHIKFCFHLSSIFQLLPSKICEKIKTLQTRWPKIKSQLCQRKRNVGNSLILSVQDSNPFRNPGKMKVLLYVLCVEAISVYYVEEKKILLDTRTPQNKGICECCTTTKKINRFWCKLSNCKPRPKSSES